MKLSELIEAQKQLNKALGQYPESTEQLAMALTEECGEVAREIRTGMAKLTEEINDLLKLTLVGLIRFSAPEAIKEASDCWDFWGDGGFAVHESFAAIIAAFPDHDGSEAISAIIDLCRNLGISKDDLTAAYLAKWDKNMVRIGRTIAQ